MKQLICLPFLLCCFFYVTSLERAFAQCTPPFGICSSVSRIANVTIGTLNNNSTCASGGYINYAGTVAAPSLGAGVTYTISVTNDIVSYPSTNMAVWIDYNRNSIFEASEFKNLGSIYGSPIVPVINTISIPVTASLGLTKMRVRVRSNYSGAADLTGNDACTAVTYGETEDYSVNIVAVPACSGTPAGGTTSAPSGSICPNKVFALTVTGGTTDVSGLTYQWQSSTDGSIWTDINGATSTRTDVSQTVTTWYRRKITCSNGPFAYSSSLQISMNPINLCYCTPPTSTCSVFPYAGIDSVSVSNIHNKTSCSANGYADYTGSVSPGNIQAGTYLPVYLRFNTNNPTGTKYIGLGIDFNHNGTFELSESMDLGTGTATSNKLIRIPFNALTGNTRMRIRVTDGNIGMCDPANYGETEDYLVNIGAAATPGPNFSFYVNPLATGTGSGLSWVNAFTSLTTALNTVLPSDTIRVAKGTYAAVYPYFNFKDSVVLLGGYPNTGNPTDAQRNWGTNPSILTGAGLQIMALGSNGFVLDGFILQDVSFNQNDGGALRIYNGVSPKIRHCVFRNNQSTSFTGSGSAIKITNSSPIISDCIFINNNNANSGSVILNESNSNTVFTNCVFARNKGKMNIVENNQSTSNITNCDFVMNQTLDGKTVSAANLSTVTIRNSIFYNNEKQVVGGLSGGYSVDSSEIESSNSTVSVSNSITQVYDYGNVSLLSKNPKFRDTSNITGADNFYYTSDDGLQLNNPCSPAMNAGSNALAAGISTDILGNARVFASVVDLGAYEVQSSALPIPKTLYVNKLASGNGNGTSWANAMTDIQTAMQSCSDTIRVAAGTYYPSDNYDKISIWLENKRVLLGGYPNTGNPTDAQRNPQSFPTILSGNLPNGGGAKSDVIIRGRTVDSTAVTDGFIIRDADAYSANEMSAIYLVNNTNPVFRNCTVSNNSTDGRGSGLKNTNASNPKFENSIFENNILTNIGEGSAVANINSNPVFRKCIFRFNSNYIAGVTPSSGGAVYNNGSNALFDSCSFVNNIANNWGGAMDNVYSNPVITNCQFMGNYVTPAGSFGGNAVDINNDHSSPLIYNCFFSDSAGCNYGGSIVNQNQSNPSVTKCVFNSSTAYASGGAVFNDNSSPLFNSCIFSGTKASGDGGVFYNTNGANPTIVNCVAYRGSSGGQGSFMYNLNSNPTIKNTTIVNGFLPSIGNSFRGGVIVNYGTTQVTLSNSILWGNTIISGQNVPNGDILDLTNTATPTLMNNCISQAFGTTGVNGNLVGKDPLFNNLSNPAGPDNIYYTIDDGLNLANCSPALNAGSNASIAGYTTDIRNNPRIFNSTVDMGAYELQLSPGLATNTWTGAVSNIWENASNWSLGIIPNPCTMVVINSGAVLLSSNATIYNLTIGTGATITVHTGYNLIVLH